MCDRNDIDRSSLDAGSIFRLVKTNQDDPATLILHNDAVMYRSRVPRRIQADPPGCDQAFEKSLRFKQMVVD
jgi:hypothetical protein